MPEASERIHGSKVDVGAALAEVAGFTPTKFGGFDELAAKIGEAAGIRLGFGGDLPFMLSYNEVEEVTPELVLSAKLEDNVNYRLKLAPFSSSGVLSISRPIFYCWLELAMGGAKNAETIYPERAPTDLELGVGALFGRRCCDGLSVAFKGVSTITEVKVVPAREDDSLGDWLDPESQICLFYDAKVGSVSGEIALIIPTKMIIPLRAQAVDTQPDEDGSPRIDAVWDGLLKSAVETTQIDLSVILGRAESTLGDISQLQVGSLVRLDKPTGEPVLVEALGEPVFEAVLGINRGRYMLKFEHMIENVEEGLNGLPA